MITIENEQFAAQINPLGAELTQLTRKADGKQYIWNDTTGQYWGRHAPLLFPAIGKSNADHYRLGDKTLPMKQHGFARDYNFTDVTQAGPDTVRLVQTATVATKAVYPFAYELAVTYTVTSSGLSLTVEVANHEAATTSMPFALGIHPGFQLHQPLANYTLSIADADLPLTKFGIGPVPFRNGQREPIAEATGNQLPLSHALLDDGLLIIDTPHATSATLASQDGQDTITLSLADFPYLTLWSPEKKNAPFVCVEPFAGLPDQAGDPSDWAHKLGNQTLPGGQHQTFHLTMTLA